jgi:hypothetical protein
MTVLAVRNLLGTEALTSRARPTSGWRLVKTRYDDGGLSGGTLNGPEITAHRH